MRKINIVTGFFCLYAVISKMIYCLLDRQPIGEVDDLGPFTDYKMVFADMWLIAFGAILIVWVWSQFKKADNTKKWLTVLTLVFALGMSITDNLYTKFYLSDIVVNGEMLK